MRILFPGRAAGYTFIELLVAVAVLAMIAAPLLGLLVTGFSTVSLAGQQTAAVNLCRAGMESAKGLGYTALHEHYTAGGNEPVEENPVAGFPAFRRVTAVQPVSLCSGDAASPELELLLIRVTVFWTAGGVERSETLESYLSFR